MKRLSFAEWTVILLFVSIVGLLGLVLRDYLHLKDRVVTIALDNAKTISNIAASAHTQYSNSIKAAGQNPAIDFTTSPTPVDNNLHFPATFSQELSKRIRDDNNFTRVQIYSDDPFESQRQRELDSFQQNAINALNTKEEPFFWSLRNVDDGQHTIRLAQPMVMGQSCVSCHNDARWKLAKRDWRVGDVRGVREVEVIVPEMNAMAFKA